MAEEANMLPEFGQNPFDYLPLCSPESVLANSRHSRRACRGRAREAHAAKRAAGAAAGGAGGTAACRSAQLVNKDAKETMN